jgi:1-acyl-sn-glycerol-3-phosphate acyltransferase
MNRHLEVPSKHLYRFAVRARPLVCATKHLGLGVSYSGAENIPDDSKPYIIAPKHSDWPDSFAVADVWLKERGASMYSIFAGDKFDEISSANPYRAKILRKLGCLPIKRTGNAVPGSEIRQIDEVVDDNGILCWFPEGDCSRGDEVRVDKIKRFICLFAVQRDLTIVPVGIAGTDPDKPGNVHVHVGQAILPQLEGFDVTDRWSQPTIAKHMFSQLVEGMQQAQQIAHRERTAALEPAITL